jgi:hypothetical protein
MDNKPSSKPKTKAQAMVEFALVLMLLLTLLYGILESGRLLFIYASTVTAARQAVRYGSATGNNSGGVPYYRDCAGIRNAAKRIGFINTFTDANIVIMYDRGLDSNGNPVAITGVPTNAEACPIDAALIRTGDRIKVRVSTNWQPIIVSLVPLQAFTITKQSERTMLSSISIGVTAAPGAWSGTGNLSLQVSALPTTYSSAGQLITYTYVLRNTGSIDLAGPFSLTANNTSATCGAGTTLAPGATITCTGTYYITQADLDAGNVVS